mmetsp:Transcript_109439/g.306079  ORF Transcript_109439/g.306079 Transcript_109439/m.306079 type:complete len:202 (+) Transcript_109439:233-838(+)
MLGRAPHIARLPQPTPSDSQQSFFSSSVRGREASPQSTRLRIWCESGLLRQPLPRRAQHHACLLSDHSISQFEAPSSQSKSNSACIICLLVARSHSTELRRQQYSFFASDQPRAKSRKSALQSNSSRPRGEATPACSGVWGATRMTFAFAARGALQANNRHQMAATRRGIARSEECGRSAAHPGQAEWGLRLAGRGGTLRD